MAELPSANTTLTETVQASAAGDLLAIWAPAALNADAAPRFFANSAALIAFHGYCQGADYAALHIGETRKGVLFQAVPIATPGVVGRKNTSGNSGTSVADVSVGGDGALEETDGAVRVKTGGTIGTDQIQLELSLDGQRTWKKLRLGTANSYVIPNVGLSLSFGAGDLVTGDVVLTWHSTAPRWDQAGIQAAREALAAQQKQARSVIVIGDMLVEDDASDVLTEANAYATTNTRFVRARTNVRDRLPPAEMSQVQARMTGSPNITFAEVGATGDTITRSSGDFTADGFAVGDTIRVTGAVASAGANNITGVIASLTATVITLGSTDLVDEGPIGGVSITAEPTLTFAEVGATGDTITRNRGSWLDDGFRVGDLVTVDGTSSNDFAGASPITAVTATVLTMGSDDLAAEVVGSFGVSVTAGESKTEHTAAMDAEFADIDSEERINIAFGRGRKLSPVLGYRFRRPSSWAASIREFQHDYHIATWRKSDGPLSGWDLEDANGNLYEHDERIDGGALAARFTCFRTWANGPAGVFIAQDLTRAGDDAALSLDHNMQVANVACSVAQREAENAIGTSLVLDPTTGFATSESLGQIKARVDSALQRELLSDVRGEGQRASSAEWNPATNNDLRGPNATMTAVLALNLNGTIVHLNQTVQVNPGA